MLPLFSIVALGATPEAVDAALAACATQPVHPLPQLSDKQRKQLLQGEVVRMLDKASDPGQPSAAVGIGVLQGSIEALWIACQDPHASVDASLTEFVIEDHGADHQVWYGYYDLPRPLQDRQWVVDSTNNHAMAKATGGPPDQSALAWVLAQGDDVVAIPGTKSIERMQQNIDALDVELSADEVASLADAIPAGAASGTRYPAGAMKAVQQ